MLIIQYHSSTFVNDTLDLRSEHQLAKLCLNNYELLCLVERLAIDCCGKNDLRISPLYSIVLYCLESDEVEVMIEAAAYFMKNETRITSFHAASYHSITK